MKQQKSFPEKERDLEPQQSYRKKILLDFGLLTLLIVVTAAIAALYISSERYFYYFDHITYSQQTSELVSTLSESIFQGLRLIKVSLSTDYNKLPCLPLVPFIFIFGDSRLVFIVSCALVYILPFALVMGAIAMRLIPVHPRAVFWSTVFLTLFVPPTWTSTLRGYPDIGGAAIIGLAVLVYLKDIKLKHWWQVPLIGFLLALAILFRRHFAYSARAFLVAMILQGPIFFFPKIQNNLRRALQHLTRYGILVGLIAVSSFVTLSILAPTFTQRVLTTNYRSLYSSYEQPISVIFQYFGSKYGLLLWLLTIIGFSTGILTRVLVRSTTSFIVIFGSLSWIQWGLFARQLGIHRTTHFTFLFVLGLAAFMWTTWVKLKGKARVLISGPGMLLLLGNAVIGLAPLGQFYNTFFPWFSANGGPMVRYDYDEIVRLFKYLRGVATNKDAIYIEASSTTFNYDLVRQGEKQLYTRENQFLNILVTPHIDSRDFYPLEKLLQAQYVIVATPFQHHLASKEQDVVKVVVDAFTENWEFAQDFKRLPEQFTLEQGVTISIYKRTRPTSLETTLQTLSIMRERIQPQPGSQSDWMIFSQFHSSWISKSQDGTVSLSTHPSYRNKLPTTSFLYFGSVPEEVQLTGAVEFPYNQCIGLSLRLSALNQQGDVVNTTKISYSSKDPSNFSLSLQGKNAAYLRLDLVSYNDEDNIDYCSTSIKNLSVSSFSSKP